MTLSLLTFLPLVGSVTLLAIPGSKKALLRGWAATFAAITMLVSIGMTMQVDFSVPGWQLMERVSWMPEIGVQYLLAVDGLSVPLILLTTVLCFLAVIASFGIEERVKEYFAFFLLLETAMLGVFVALDLFLFYIFWELTLIPMYFLIGIWGGPRKEHAALKFFIFTLLGSIFMLVGILAVYFTVTPNTFDLVEILKQQSLFSRTFQIWVFVGFFIGFAVKVPVFPFHTWLPLAHVEAPTAISVILAGVLLKLGTYGILRFAFPMFPLAAQACAKVIAVIALINILYGAFCSLAQTDLKRMIAYSSINHMGYALLGLAALNLSGFSGATFQMVAHGIITGMLFLLVGVLYDRAHTREIDAFGGIASVVPVFAGFMMLASFASLGVPLLAGFVGEFLCFAGAYPVFPLITGLSLIGILLSAGFFLVMLRKVFLGPLNRKWDKLSEINGRELFTIIPLVVLTIALGVYPALLLKSTKATLTSLVDSIHSVERR